MENSLQIGKWNQLQVIRQNDKGIYLKSGPGAHEEILLPSRLVKKEDSEVDSLHVFVCYDSNDQLMATTEKPLAEVGEFALLKVISTQKIGAFLDWGLGKDLFLPFAEQIHDVRVGDSIIVGVYLDNSHRIAASMRLEKFLQKLTPGETPFKIGESVHLLITGKTDLGFKAIINGTHLGVIFENEVFTSLFYGQKTKGFIKNIRSDGKIDLSLQASGHRAAENIEPLILQMLEDNQGFLAINDKTEAEAIYQMFGVSKKKYKMILGSLYKKRIISVHDDGIRLIKKP